MENSSAHAHLDQEAHEHNHGFDTKAVWRTFWILLVITCIELVIGMFVAPRFPHTTKIWFNILYIIFTSAKAFYIIAEFMHLKHETKALIWSILIPMALVAWLMVALIAEGSYYYESVTNYFK